MKLTQSIIDKLSLPERSTDKIFFDDEVTGLGLRIRAAGSRKYVVHWRQGRFQRRATIGSAGILNLAEARRKARKILVEVDEGRDPASAKAMARSDASQIFLALSKEYLNSRASVMKASSLDQCTRHLELYWRTLHKLPLKSISRPIIAAELRSMARERGAVATDRGRSTLSAFFSWAIGEGYTESNPVVGTNKSSNAKPRERVLSDAEIVRIWGAAPEDDYGSIVRLLLLTGQRRDEIARLAWEEIDFSAGLILLPSERTKNSRAHEIPLSQLAVSILQGLPRRMNRQHVFGAGNKGYSGFSKSKTALDRKSGVSDWTLHDLRRTMATRLGDIGIQPHVIEAILNHASGHKSGVAGIYNRSSYLSEKRSALEKWSNYILTELSKADGTNITRIIDKRHAAIS